MKKVFLGVALAALSVGIAGCDLSNSPAYTGEENSSAEAQDESTEETGPIDTSEYSDDISYEDLARNPDDYEDDKVTFSGQVAQVLDGDDSSQYRLAVDGDFNQMILIEIPANKLDSRILEDDNITVYGKSVGVITYKSTMGGDITVPAIKVQDYELEE